MTRIIMPAPARSICMSASVRFGLLAAVVLGSGLSAQIGTDFVERRRSDFHTRPTAADRKREGGTPPRDWNYARRVGVTPRQVPFYGGGGTPLYGKLFLPRQFSSRGRWPAVVA